MKLLFDSFWRAAIYCLHPRVIALSILPLVLIVACALGLGYFFWDPALDWVRRGLDSWSMLDSIGEWMQGLGVGNLKSVIAPLIVIFCVTPLLVLLCLFAVALLMTPALTNLVGERRFGGLERKKGGSLWLSLAWSLGSSFLALIAMVVSMPLWLIPPLVLVLPPLIWGWLTYRVMAYDVLGVHASVEERQAIFKQHRWVLLSIGVVAGYLGAAPGVVWASGAMFAVGFVFLMPVAIWLYTLVFAFSALWFAHYCLAALDKLRLTTLTPPSVLSPSLTHDHAPTAQPPAQPPA
jgi:Etoposide-induced protein 2.4 (EI24)